MADISVLRADTLHRSYSAGAAAGGTAWTGQAAVGAVQRPAKVNAGGGAKLSREPPPLP